VADIHPDKLLQHHQRGKLFLLTIPYDEAIRDILLTSPRDTFTFEDITGMPWIEIDCAADIEPANAIFLPRILSPIDNPGKIVTIRQIPDQGEKRIQ
jgi:hypothetical protein